MGKRIKIVEHGIFQGASSHRRVVGVIRDRIYYSVGGDGGPRSCKRPAFLRWIRRDNATCVNV